MKMRKKIKQLLIFLSITIFITLIFFNLYSFPSGYTGVTLKGDALGCICHGTNQPTPEVYVFFEGPDSVATGQTAFYKIKITHGPAVVGGFDAAVYSGIIDTIAADTTLKRDESNGDLTHRFAKTFSNDTIVWSFKYTAPGSEQTDTLYAVGNSCNNDTSSSNDEWNFSSNFLIRVYNPIGITANSTFVDNYKLYQNYPNPFNPVTKIKFDIKESTHVKITVYDVSGKIISVLMNKLINTGSYEVEFDGNRLPSGVYFYKFEAGQFTDSKTMILVK